MWTRFTEPARLVVYRAQEAARSTGEHYVTSDHLLHGLIEDDDGSVSNLLLRLEIPAASILEIVSKPPLEAQPPIKAMQLDKGSKQSIDRAYDVARCLGHTWIGPLHLLAGVLENAEKRKDDRFCDAGLTYASVVEEIAQGGDAWRPPTKGVWPPPPKTGTPPPRIPQRTYGEAALVAFGAAIISVGVSISYLTPLHLSTPWPKTYPYLWMLNIAAILCASIARRSPQRTWATLANIIAFSHSFVMLSF